MSAKNSKPQREAVAQQLQLQQPPQHQPPQHQPLAHPTLPGLSLSATIDADGSVKDDVDNGKPRLLFCLNTLATPMYHSIGNEYFTKSLGELWGSDGISEEMKVGEVWSDLKEEEVDPMTPVNPLQVEGKSLSDPDKDLLEFVLKETDMTDILSLLDAENSTTSEEKFQENSASLTDSQALPLLTIYDSVLNDEEDQGKDDPDFVLERPPKKKRGRGRPRVLRRVPYTMENRPCGRPLDTEGVCRRLPSETATSVAGEMTDHTYDCSSRTSPDMVEAKYRRIRDLNNAASKRCRQKRKEKLEALLQEEEELKSRNYDLRVKCKEMEDLVARLKSAFIAQVANPEGPKLEFEKEKWRGFL